MSLLDILARRNAIPSMGEGQRIKGGGDMPPMRGVTPWPTATGFENQQKQMLQEMLRAMQMREQGPQQSLQQLIPLLRARQG